MNEQQSPSIQRALAKATTLSAALMLVAITDTGLSQSYDFKSMGTQTTPSLALPGVTITASNDINLLNLNGLGVVGGSSNTSVEGSEEVVFEFDEPMEAVYIRYSSSGNQNGTGGGGDTLVTYYDETNTAVFTRPMDSQSIQDLYNVTYDLTSVGVGSYPTLEFPSVDPLVTVTASADINFGGTGGLGVTGGVNNNQLDGSESMSFSFVQPVRNVVLGTGGSSGNLNMNGTGGDAFLTGLGSDGSDLGPAASFQEVGGHLVSSRLGDSSITDFTIQADADSQQIDELHFKLDVLVKKLVLKANVDGFRISTLAFRPVGVAPPLTIANAVCLEFPTIEGVTYCIQDSASMETWSTVEQLTGDGNTVTRFYKSSEDRRFFRILED